MEDIYFKITGSDTYKAVKQYIKNGLGLSKEDIEIEIRSYACKVAEQAVEKAQLPRILEDKIDRRINEALTGGYGWNGQSELKHIIEKAVEAEVQKQVAKVVQEKMADFFNAAIGGNQK